MIRPDQVPDPKPTRNEEAEIEAYFDKYLAAGRLIVPETRSGWSLNAIMRVLNKYRAVKWTVTMEADGYHFRKPEPPAP